MFTFTQFFKFSPFMGPRPSNQLVRLLLDNFDVFLFAFGLTTDDTSKSGPKLAGCKRLADWNNFWTDTVLTDDAFMFLGELRLILGMVLLRAATCGFYLRDTLVMAYVFFCKMTQWKHTNRKEALVAANEYLKKYPITEETLRT